MFTTTTPVVQRETTSKLKTSDPAPEESLSAKIVHASKLSPRYPGAFTYLFSSLSKNIK